MCERCGVAHSLGEAGTISWAIPSPYLPFLKLRVADRRERRGLVRVGTRDPTAGRVRPSSTRWWTTLTD